jgi:CSLREA domain-containing protein
MVNLHMWLIRRQLTGIGAAFALLAALLSVLLQPARPASAATYTIGCAEGSGDLAALIAAIASANSNGQDDTINLDPDCSFLFINENNVTANGANALPVITSDGGRTLTINGNGATFARTNDEWEYYYEEISDAMRFIEIASGARLIVNDLTFENGEAGVGGAIYNAGAATFNRSTFSNNRATVSDGGALLNAAGATLTISRSMVLESETAGWGAVHSFAGSTLTIIDSTFTGNDTSGNGGAVSAAGAVTIAGSTFHYNYANGDGGALYVEGGAWSVTNVTLNENEAVGSGGALAVAAGAGASATINNATFRANKAHTGASIAQSSGNTLSIGNSIVAYPAGSANCAGTITNLGNNIRSGSAGTCNTFLNADPLLGPLQDNGGPTETSAPAVGSPAIGGANGATCASTDQRGVARPVGGACDIGAVEYAALQSGPFTVTTAADLDTPCLAAPDGVCSLRAAIKAANANGWSADSILFNIPGAGPHTITPGYPLPAISSDVTIDGYSQPGASVNTLSGASNAVLRIVLDGSSAGVADGLRLSSGDVVVRGLVINNFSRSGIRVDGAYSVNITGNFIGADVTGTLDRGNGLHGINLQYAGSEGYTESFIGGTTPELRNVISGNSGAGIVTGSPVMIRGNSIGVGANGAPLGNGGAGVRIVDAYGVIVGGIAPGAGNSIANNGGDGVAVVGSYTSGNPIRGNSIANNGGLGIDLGDDGVTANDANDADEGPNNLQNFPTVSAFEVLTTTTFAGSLTSEPNTTYAIDIYAGPACDASGNGEGSRYVASFNVTTNGSGVANYSQDVAIILPGGSWITAVATDPYENSSEFSACAPLFSNEAWVNALPITLTPTGAPSTAAGNVSQFITRENQARWYRFPITPDSFVSIELESGPGFNMSLHSDLDQEYIDLLTPGNEAAHAAAESTTGFLPKGFLATEFLPADYLPKGFLPKGFLPKGFLPKGFLPKGFLPSSVLPKGFLPKGFLPPGVDEERYSGAIRRTLIAIADDPDATVQSIERNTWDLTGNLYLRVAGPESMLDSFTVTITVRSGFCQALAAVPDGTPAIAGAQPPAGALTTLILWDSERMPTSDPTGNMNDLRARLATFATQPGINAAVIDLAAIEAGNPKYPGVAFANDAADAAPTCSQAKNIVADEITRVIDVYRQANTLPSGATSLQYIVLVGNDNEIPFARYRDEGGLAFESEYFPPTLDQSSSDAALRQNSILGQDIYGAQERIWRGSYYLPVPDLAVGRLVGTVEDVIGLLDAYTATNGVVTPDSALITGYDFVADAAQIVRDEITRGLNSPTCTACITPDTLIQPVGEPPTGPNAWTADDVRERLLLERNDLVVFSGHFDAGGLLAADYTTAVGADEIRSSSVDFTNAVIFSLGCHAGYNIPQADAIEFFSPQPDWALAFAERGATFIGATGYAYGDTELVEYGERLLVNFTRELRTGSGPVPLGAALRDAKIAYLANKADLGGTDDKTLIEFVVYGLPHLAVDLPGARITPPVADSLIDGGVPAASGPGSDLGLQVGQAGGNQDITITPTLTPVTVQLTDVTEPVSITTTYYTGRDGVVANPVEPILPLEVYDVTLPNQVLRGVGFRGGVYTEVSDITPLTGAPGSEQSVGHVSFRTDIPYPVQFWSKNFFDAIVGGRTNLTVAPAQYIADDPTDISGRMRLYSSLTFRTFYIGANWADGPAMLRDAAVAAAPDIVDVSSETLVGGNVMLRVRVVGDELPGVQQVWITYTDPTAAFPRSWQSIDLQQSPGDPELWTTPAGGVVLPPNARFIVQAANGAGLVTLDANGGVYYPITPLVPPVFAPETATAIDLLSAPANGIYARNLTFQARLRTATGTPLANQQLVLAIGGQRAFATTNAAGEVTFVQPLDLRPGTYRARIYYTGQLGELVSYGRATARFAFTVQKEGSSLTFLSPDPIIGIEGGEVSIVVRLTDVFDQPIGDRTVLFIANGPGGAFGRTAKTSPEGRAALGRVLWPAGSYTITAYFGGIAPLPSGNVNVPDLYYNGATPVSRNLIINKSAVPPVTTATVTGVNNPVCPADCFSGSATVTLSVTPPTATTFYSLNGGAVQTYSGPIVITTEGSNTLTFYSVNGALSEAPQTLTVKVTRSPTTPILDNFNRANGKLGANWQGRVSTGEYRIYGQRVDVVQGGLAYWYQSFGATQEAYMRLSAIDPKGRHHTLALKVNGANGGNGAILVSYDAVGRQIVIEALAPGKGWRTVGTIPITMQNGDILGARANADGTVEVYVNCVRIGGGDTRPVTGNTYVGKGGRIGVWFHNTGGAFFDDFGGGDAAP